MRIKHLVVGAMMIVASLFVASLGVSDVYAALDPIGGACGTTGSSSVVCSGASPDGGKTEIKNIVNLLLYVLGIISVIVIIVGGIRYTTSGGDANGVKGAKDTILYAVVGLVVALLAYSIVNFVLGRF